MVEIDTIQLFSVVEQRPLLLKNMLSNTFSNVIPIHSRIIILFIEISINSMLDTMPQILVRRLKQNDGKRKIKFISGFNHKSKATIKFEIDGKRLSIF